MRRHPLVFLSSVLVPATMLASTFANALRRPAMDLAGRWASIVDPSDNGYLDYRSEPFDRRDPPGGDGLDDESELVEYAFLDAHRLRVPGDWNSQEDKLFYYEGTVWYRRHFEAPSTREGRRYILYFGGANYECDVYLNGRKLGRHVGGFTPFQFEVTDRLIEGNNSLVVRVNNQRRRDGVPTLNTDWWNYGGITREVRLIELPETFIADYTVELARGGGDGVRVRVRLDGPSIESPARIRIGELASIIPLKWIPKESVKPNSPSVRCAASPFTRKIGWAKDLGCNFARLAHYPHNEHMARVADEMGILLWEEIPVYWTIDWENPEALANASAQITALIERGKNRASVITWSVANESPGSARHVATF